MQKRLNIIIMTGLFFLLIYTRLINSGWGLPYPMHPDERNMVDSILQMSCYSLFNECLNPHFFAYGQLPLYLVYFSLQLKHLFLSNHDGISFVEATVALRFFSALASSITAYILLKAVDLMYAVKKYVRYAAFLIIIFSPYFIQFSHFGTTESLLMLLYSTIFYVGMYYVLKKGPQGFEKFLLLEGFFLGISMSIKSSSFLFAPFVLMCLVVILKEKKLAKIHVARFLLLSALIAFVSWVVLSPYSVLSFSEFFQSMTYESAVATGAANVFYTRQFETSIPILFPLIHIFPYTLGFGEFFFFILGFFLLPYSRKYNLLRFAFLIFFLPTSFLYAKWTRFISPVFPFATLFAIFFFFECIEFLSRFKKRVFIVASSVVLFLLIVYGIGYLSVYTEDDIRLQASNWIETHIPASSYILSETANVVDIPLPTVEHPLPPSYALTSFNFYDIDQNPVLYADLQTRIKNSQYIFVPSRRLFKNVNGNYPLLSDYYTNLFSGKYGFRQIEEFSNYPHISLFGKTILTFPDENAEETWTVFDHPVIRIFKKEE